MTTYKLLVVLINLLCMLTAEDVPSENDDGMNPLWGLTEASIVDSLMWGKHEKQFALPIEHLEAHCEVYGSAGK